MKVLYQKKQRCIALQSETHTLLFRRLHKKDVAHDSPPSVQVEIASNDNLSSNFKPLINKEVHGCLGLIHVGEQVFVAIVVGAVTNVATPLVYELIDRIYNVEFISLSHDDWDSLLSLGGQEDYYTEEAGLAIHPCSELKRLLSNGSFYFSTDFDLTSILQNRGIIQSKLANRKQLLKGIAAYGHKNEHFSTEFMWNAFMMDDLIRFRSNLDDELEAIFDTNRFLTTAIRGFAKTTSLNYGESMTIISKQSWKRAGTRYNARGIDDDGNVANFVETEFIYDASSSNGTIYSFVQIRGSVPAFWEQDSTLINPKITITRSLGATQQIFDKHFTNIGKKYGVCHVVNLLSKTKPAEVQVLRRFSELIEGSRTTEVVEYTQFDFHQEVKNIGFSGATNILPELATSMEEFGVFSYDTITGEVVTRQDGVFRVNCLDCLDRTNLIEQVICHKVFESYGGDRESLKFNNIWADNGDAISQIYTGTNALKSSFSRSGKMNIAGALSDVTKSVSRMYQNTFVDNKKQSTMDLLLGYDARNSKPVRIYDPVSDFVNSELKAKKSVFTTAGNISIFAGTYNLNATTYSSNMDLTPWLFPPDNSFLPDIYAIGLQEIIELNAGSILNADSSKASRWSEALTQQLNSQSNDKYLLLRTESLSSMALYLFVKESLVNNISHVFGASKKTGLGGMTVNKGACAVRFEYGSTSFALVTSHLAAGTTAIAERYNDYVTVMEGLTFSRNYTLPDHDHILWFGDLNYRIALPNDQCRFLVEKGAFDDLYRQDQLQQEMKKKGAFFGFKEGPIIFYPTYKFDKGTNEYDTSEKQRIPSWTDRILYQSDSDIPELEQLNYSSIFDMIYSDHKPVFSTFKSQVEFVDEAKKLALQKQLYEKYKAQHDDDVSIYSSSTLSSVPISKSNSFRRDTMTELNLIDDDDSSPSPPKLPSRPMSQAPSTLRKVPPPFDGYDSTAKPAILRSASLTAPIPPAPRRTVTTVSSSSNSTTSASSPVPLGFSLTPLVPSNKSSRAASPETKNGDRNDGKVASPPLNSKSTISLKPLVPSRTSSPISVGSGPQKASPTESQHKLAPMKPNKPVQLSSSKQTEVPTPPQSNTKVPEPPAPRNIKSMSDWKPLMPN